MTALGIILMDKFGRRPLLLIRRLRNLYRVMELNENNFELQYIHRFLQQEHAWVAFLWDCHSSCRNGKHGNGKIQRICIEDVNRKRKKRKERLKSIVKLHTLESVSRKKEKMPQRLVSSFIRAARDWRSGEGNQNDEMDAVRSLDLLYRKAEMLLNNLLNMYDRFDDEGWLKECKKHTWWHLSMRGSI
ncbi:uncharacterized protein LOC115959770 [Quercus lobata]|uniref:uncharacterized protein LOC115959770 n=1 Tax=Quercus lobata TaxID=97700 RepID=UPI001243B323|nr:uncharacterized protein LOC115959770 [Quercus lobata]